MRSRSCCEECVEMGVKGTLEEAMLGTHILVRTANQKVNDVHARRATERAGTWDDRP